jgi:hypothetical protein
MNRKAFDSAVEDLNNGVHPVHRKGRQPVTPTDGAGAVPAGGVRRSCLQAVWASARPARAGLRGARCTGAGEGPPVCIRQFQEARPRPSRE